MGFAEVRAKKLLSGQFIVNLKRFFRCSEIIVQIGCALESYGMEAGPLAHRIFASPDAPPKLVPVPAHGPYSSKLFIDS